MKDSATTTASTAYHYLWHLAALGVLDQAPDGSVTSTLWDEIAARGDSRPATVVMIDVGCSFDHPNLATRVDRDASIDFTAGPQGQRMGSKKDGIPACAFDGLDTSDLRLDGLSAKDQSLFDEVVQHLMTTRTGYRTTGNVEAMFASHGTAVAGLVVGGPEVQPDGSEPTQGILPYFGVDPMSRLVSVRTGFEDDPLQFIAALLYAKAQSPDVIVIPRGLPDPQAGTLAPKDDFQAELEQWQSSEAADLLHRIETLRKKAGGARPYAPQRSLTATRLWHLVAALLKAISNHVPVVCAAGNEGESQLLYPASLATRENGIIAVGAVSSAGLRSGYGNYGEGLTLVAPSDDMEVFNRHQMRLPPDDAAAHAARRLASAQIVPLSSRSLLTTDVPGNFGYTEAPQPDAPGGYYAPFGGTSGAAALVAGVIALVRRAERAADPQAAVRDGRDIRALLTRTARHDIPDGAEPVALRGDTMNAASEDAEALSVFFGAGLVDAAAAVHEVMTDK